MPAEEISDKYHDPENFFLPAIQIYGRRRSCARDSKYIVSRMNAPRGKIPHQTRSQGPTRKPHTLRPIKLLLFILFGGGQNKFWSENYFSRAQKQDHLSDNQREKLAVHLNTPRRTSHEISYHGIMMAVRACNLWGRWKWSSPWKRRRLWNRLAEKLPQSPSVMRLKGCLPLLSLLHAENKSNLLSLERSSAAR